MINPTIKLTFISFALFIQANLYASSAKAPEIDLSENTLSFREVERNLTKLETSFYDSTPDKRNDGLTPGKLNDKATIIALAKEIADGKHAAYDSLLIAHEGKLVFESYYAYGRVNLPHYQASASKGYTSFAVGRAIQMGYLSMQDLHKPVLSFLKNIDRENLVTGVDKITLDHTLSMRSGLRISREKQQELLKDPDQVKGQKLAQTYFSHSTPVTGESQIYHYQSMDPQITMLVLDAVLPGAAKDFIKKELLDKLGINQYYWKESVNGLPEAASSTNMTSRDMIKWGTLLKNKGKWQGEQLISEAFLNQATGSVATPTDDEFDYSGYKYGYYFWGKSLKVVNQEYEAAIAWGGGTQMVIAIDELNLVVALTARARNAGKETIEMLEQRILPTFVPSD